MPHLSISGPSGMGFEHFRDCFHPKYSISGFPHFFQFFSHIIKCHISLRIAHVFGMAHLLAMTKPLGGVHRIAVGETLYQFTSHTLCLQFCDAFTTHFSSH